MGAVQEPRPGLKMKTKTTKILNDDKMLHAQTSAGLREGLHKPIKVGFWAKFV